MVTAVVRPCPERLADGRACAIPTERTRCDLHEQKRQQQRNASRPEYRDPEYLRERARILGLATTCAICGLPPTRRDPLTADHIVPRAHGGGVVGNLRACHKSCNSRMGATVRR